MVCGLRLSKSWKSSFFKLSMTLPLWSRTTTRTSTRFTRTLKVAAESRVTTSAVGGDCDGVSEGFAGCEGGLSCAGAAWAGRGCEKREEANGKGSSVRSGNKARRYLKRVRTRE